MPIRHLFLLLASAAFAGATTVQPPTFPELVGEADGIYRGRVVAVQPRRVAAPDGTNVIKTFVTFGVDRTLKGVERAQVVLEFLGGTIGDESLEVGGMPRFHVGQREILFVQKNGVQFCPLVRLGHGRYRVERDDTRQTDFVARDNFAPLAAPDDVALPLEHGPAHFPAAARPGANALTPEAFEAEIQREMKRGQSGALQVP